MNDESGVCTSYSSATLHVNAGPLMGECAHSCVYGHEPQIEPSMYVCQILELLSAPLTFLPVSSLLSVWLETSC